RTWAEYFTVGDAPQARLEQSLKRADSIACVCERGYSSANRLGGSEQGRCFEVIACELVVLCSCQLEYPLAKRQVFEKPAHHSQLQMAVSVYKTGKDRRTSKVDLNRIRELLTPLGFQLSADEYYAVFFNHDRAVADRRSADREYPFCAVNISVHPPID